MIKIVLLFSLFLMSGFLGFQTAKLYDNKTKFFEDCLNFVKNIKIKISFLKTDLIIIFSKYNYLSKFEDVKNQIGELIKQDKKIDLDDIKSIISKNITLDDNQLNIVSQMFFELGKFGYYEQLERIQYYENCFQDILSNQKNRAEKMMPFCKKMGILIGLLVCIVLI